MARPLSVGLTDVGVRQYGEQTTVPDDRRAKLMYYLDTVCGLLDMSLEANLGKLRNYLRPDLLTDKEENSLLLLCFVLSPDELRDKVIFQDDGMCREGGINTFYELSRVRHQLLIYDAVLVGGRTRQVKKIMACKRQWLATYWAEPMKIYAHRLAMVLDHNRKKGGASGSQGCCTIL